MPLAKNSWTALLARFYAQATLQDGLHSYLDSQVRLTRYLGLCTILQYGGL